MNQLEDEHRVSTLELFFDLVFVFTLTQLAGDLRHHPTFEGVAHTVLVFAVLYWMYGGYVWLTNQVTPNLTQRRLLLMVGMAGFFICALAIPEAFGSSGLAFGLGYLLVVVVHSVLYGTVVGWGVLVRLTPFNIASAGCLIVAGLLDGSIVYAGWIAAIGIQVVTPFIAARVAPGFDIRPEHFAERHSLIMIVALGESIVAVGIGAAELTLDLSVVLAMLLGLALISSLWWAYFMVEDEAAAGRMASVSPVERFRLAINAYFYSYIPMLLGVVIMAAALEEAVADVTHSLPIAFAMALGGGVALFLVGDISFRRALEIQPRAFRVGGAVLALATILAGRYTSAAVQLALLIAILCGMLLIEARAGRRHIVDART